MKPRPPVSLSARSMCRRCPLLLLVAAAPAWSASCAAPPVLISPAARIEPHVRAVAEGHAPRGVLPGTPPAEGTVPLVLVAAGPGPTPGGPAAPEVVSAGVPFPQGLLRDVRRVALLDGRGGAVPARIEALATWPADGSIRSVLVAFHASLRPGERAGYTVRYGGAPGPEAAASAGGLLGPNPDGPITATLPASWYAASRVSGPQVPAVDDSRFPGFESKIERGIERMSPGYDTYGVDCIGKHRTYYDGPHALYQRFLRNGDADRYRRARAEATWYRAHELRFSGDRKLAVHVCQREGWTPSAPLDWAVLRRMLGQGMLDDYLLTGDPAAREAVIGIGEALRQDLPALSGGREDILTVTERNMAWTMMGLTSYYAVDPRPEVLAALRGLVDKTLAWQGRSTSGAFEHDIRRPDPGECERGPRGASPFMTALLVDALMDYHALTGDTRVREAVARAAGWLEKGAMTSDRRAFRFLWGCETNAYDDSGTADLNLLIVPVFGAAYALTRDARWLGVGDRLADIGVASMFVKQPKHWNQAMRGFGRYLGYRALAFTPPAPPALKDAAAVGR